MAGSIRMNMNTTKNYLNLQEGNQASRFISVLKIIQYCLTSQLYKHMETKICMESLHGNKIFATLQLYTSTNWRCSKQTPV